MRSSAYKKYKVICPMNIQVLKLNSSSLTEKKTLVKMDSDVIKYYYRLFLLLYRLLFYFSFVFFFIFFSTYFLPIRLLLSFFLSSFIMLHNLCPMSKNLLIFTEYNSNSESRDLPKWIQFSSKTVKLPSS